MYPSFPVLSNLLWPYFWYWGIHLRWIGGCLTSKLYQIFKRIILFTWYGIVLVKHSSVDGAPAPLRQGVDGHKVGAVLAVRVQQDAAQLRDDVRRSPGIRTWNSCLELKLLHQNQPWARSLEGVNNLEKVKSGRVEIGSRNIFDLEDRVFLWEGFFEGNVEKIEANSDGNRVWLGKIRAPL